MTGLRFVHCADLHLDSPPPGVAGQVVPFRDASRQALISIVDTCLEQEVHCLLIAGDLYDRDLQDSAPLVFFNQQMQRLADADIPVFLIKGNHDAANRAIGGLLAPNVHAFLPGAPQTELRQLGGLSVAIHGWSYAQGNEAGFQISDYPRAVADAINLGLLHTALEPGGPYAPCTPADLFAKGYDYWALGHAHVFKEFRQDGCLIINPGMPQGRKITEGGTKGAYLVEMVPGQAPQGRFFQTSSIEWARVEVDAQGLVTDSDLERLIRRRLEALVNEGNSQRFACRLQLVSVEPEIYAQRYAVKEQFERLFDGALDGRVFVESVRFEMRSGAADTAFEESASALAPLTKGEDLNQILKDLSEPLAKSLGTYGTEIGLTDISASLGEQDAEQVLLQALGYGRQPGQGG